MQLAGPGILVKSLTMCMLQQWNLSRTWSKAGPPASQSVHTWQCTQQTQRIMKPLTDCSAADNMI